MKPASVGILLSVVSLAAVGVLYVKIENLSDQVRRGQAENERRLLGMGSPATQLKTRTLLIVDDKGATRVQLNADSLTFVNPKAVALKDMGLSRTGLQFFGEGFSPRTEYALRGWSVLTASSKLEARLDGKESDAVVFGVSGQTVNFSVREGRKTLLKLPR